ncbi:proteasome-associated protein ECM29-like protein isoform X2 [Cucumis melo var. makuwa]|uniref:Proteasome-associated protein ECM29-like protein isoform X2 n=1 Tax=Cucumis melo var. makuwa TaxID=1194695 RepID=A0A5D3BB28_CUCMM|nr:proteasome-associated protein ECM29-like protein isoform X2 [Cucumis melo var. makuwa]
MGEGSLEAQLIRITQDGTYVVSEEIFGLFCPLPPEKMAESVLMDAFVMGLAPKLKAEVRAPPVKRLSNSELRTRLDKGLCFQCNEKWSHGHKCKVRENRELMLFITNEEEGLEEEPATETGETSRHELSSTGTWVYPRTRGLRFKSPHLKLYYNTFSKKRKETGKIETIESKVMEVGDETKIGLSTLHGFTEKGTIKEQKFGVTIGDGTANAIEGQEMCQRIELELPELTIGTEFLAINLGKLGVVLGIPWLWSTGFMGVHWPSKSLAFMIGNKTVILKGDPALTTEDKVISNFPPSTLRTRCFLSRPGTSSILACWDFSVFQVLKAFGSPQFFNMVFPLLFETCKSADSGQASLGGVATKTDADDRGETSVPREKILNCLTSSIKVANLDDVVEQQKNLLYLITTSLSNGFRWTVKTSTFLSINELCSRFHEVVRPGSQGKTKLDSVISFVLELSHSVSPLVVQCITTVKIAQVHISASECLLEIIKLYTDLPSVHRTDIGIKAELLHLSEIEKNEVAKSLLKTCIENLENLHQDKIQED